MKIFSAIKSLAVLATLTLSVQSLALTPAQRSEFWKKGTISVLNDDGSKKGHFEVRFMIGSDKINEKTLEAWRAAEKLMEELVIDKDDFWEKKVIREMKQGLKWAWNSCKDGIGSIPEQFCDLMDKNEKVTGFIPAAQKFKNWVHFAGQCVGDLCVTAFGGTAGLIYAVASPVAHIVYRPVAAATIAVVGGTLMPAVAYSYNAAIMGFAAFADAPKEGDIKPGDISVAWVPEKFDQEAFAAALPDDEDKSDL